jgi:hypothetical protein
MKFVNTKKYISYNNYEDEAKTYAKEFVKKYGK